MNSPLILELGRKFAQKKHWHLAMFILGSSHQLVPSQFGHDAVFKMLS